MIKENKEMIENITMREIVGKTGKPFQYLMKRTWKVAIPIILILSFLEIRINESPSLFSVLYSLSTAILVWYIPFKMLQFLEKFYQEPEKEYRTKRIFAVVFASFLYFVILIMLLISLVAIFSENIKESKEAALIVFGVLAVLLFLGVFLTSLTPSIYWSNNEFTLWQSIKLSFKGVKRYFFRLLVLSFLIYGVMVFIAIKLRFILIEYLVASFGFHLYWVVALKLTLYWMIFLWSPSILYLVARITLGKSISFPKEGENAVESVENLLEGEKK